MFFFSTYVKEIKIAIGDDVLSSSWFGVVNLLCHMIYCHSDKSYPCLVGKGLRMIAEEQIKNQLTQSKLLNFENWTNGEPQ
jgi:hypothetical protein